MNISVKFIRWVNLFFESASTAISLNDNPGNNFRIEQGMRQNPPPSLLPLLDCGRDSHTHDQEKQYWKVG